MFIDVRDTVMACKESSNGRLDLLSVASVRPVNCIDCCLYKSALAVPPLEIKMRCTTLSASVPLVQARSRVSYVTAARLQYGRIHGNDPLTLLDGL